MAARILNIALALLVFISSSGFVVNKHYCRNELKDVAIFVRAESCHIKTKVQKMPAACPMHLAKGCEMPEQQDERDCCDDESEFVKLEQDQQVQSLTVDLLKHPVTLVAIFVALKLQLPSQDARTISYLNYKPPLIVCDLSVSLQTFLF